MTDDIKDIEKLLFSTIEGEAIKLLLSGNDTQCFTTDQYDDAMETVCSRLAGANSKSLGMGRVPLDIRRRQLTACLLVDEVTADVWCLATDLKTA